MPIVSIQNSLAAGELSPSLLGRSDFKKWSEGTFTCRNFFVNYRGGVVSRGGLAYVGTCKQAGTSAPPRDIPFQFSITQGYVLEFGDQYMRVKYQGAYVTESAVTVSSVSTAGLFTTTTNHGYSVGDWVYDSGNTGFSGLSWIVASVPSGTTFTVTDLFGNAITSATASTGGTVSRIYTVTAPYAAVDLPYLKYTQSADTMTLTCVNTDTGTEYPSYELTRNSAVDWVFTEDTFSATIASPTGLTATATSSTSLTTWYSYVVTAVDATTGEESPASAACYVLNNDIGVYQGSNKLVWNQVTNAGSYNIYKTTPSYKTQQGASTLYGYIGTSSGTSFVDANITADFTVVPPVHANPFARSPITQINITAKGNNYSQSTVGYTINTSTGSGFEGIPIVVNSQVVDFLITNEGENYSSGDTITFTDSGGGTPTGTATFTANPADSDSLAFNNNSIQFVNSPTPGANQVTIAGSVDLTVQALANLLNASSAENLAVASYSANGNVLTITYNTPGTVGNGYTLVNSSAPVTFSGSTLSGGGTVGSGATGTLTIGKGSGTYPSVCAYFQQRRVYGASLNNPDTYWMTQPGLFKNMDTSIPVSAADAITGTPWSQQVNGIQWLVPMPGGLVVLTGLGAWQVTGGSSAAITPSNQDAIPQAYNGCNNLVPPIPINYDILYVQAKGGIVRDLSYNFFVNIYTGTDLTVLSNHLFNDYTINQWAWSQEPYKLVWLVRNDGTLLCLTYLREQDVFSWTRHDTNGEFVSVCSVTEPPVDAVYFIIKRYVQGAWRYYSERMDNRLWTSVDDAFCVDAGLTNQINYPNADLTVSATTGTVTCTASSSVFTSANVGDVIRVDGGMITVTTYTSGTQVSGTVTQTLVNTIPNDPNNMPYPAISGDWSISTPITTVGNLNHLEGLQVAILADGSVVPNQTVTNNQITLPYAASKVVVGLPYICQLQTTYVDHPGESTVQNRRKDITAVGIRCEMTRGIQVGVNQIDASTVQYYPNQTWTDMTEVKERTNLVTAGSAIPLYTGDYYVQVMGGWNVRGQSAIQQTYPLPASILSVITYWTPGDTD
jgi:hypothetical protein